VTRYLRELEQIPADPPTTVPAAPAVASPPPPISDPVPSLRPESRSTQLTVAVAVSVLLLLALAVVAIFWPSR